MVGVPDERWGEIGRAHIVLEAGFELEADELVRWGSERLARFKIPQLFAQEASLPRTASGKVQKSRLSG